MTPTAATPHGHPTYGNPIERALVDTFYVTAQPTRRKAPDKPAQAYGKARRMFVHHRTGRSVWAKRAADGHKNYGTFTLAEASATRKRMQAKGYKVDITAVKVAPHVSGDRDVRKAMLLQLEEVATKLEKRLGKKVRIHILSGRRSYAEQKYLYDGWQAGKPGFNPANKPGTSVHETGYAADVYLVIDGASWYPLGDGEQRVVAQATGLTFPHSHEPWHAELVDRLRK